MPVLLALVAIAAGYFGYTKYQASHTKTVTTPSWLPPIPALTKTYTDYQTIQIDPPTPMVVWDIDTNVPVTLSGAGSVQVSSQENNDVFPTGAGGTIFWMNVNGTANRMYSAFPLH